MNKNIIVLLAVLLVGVVAAVSASAFMGVFNASPTDKQAMETAIANKDYSTWKTLMENQLTQDNFNKLVKAHQAVAVRQTEQKALGDAIAANDYNAYVMAMQALASSQIVSATDFANLVARYQARQSGNSTTNQGPGMMGGYMRHGMGRGFGERI